MSVYRTLNKTLLAKVESTPGTDPTPTVGSNAIKCFGIQSSNNFDAQNTDDEHTGSLDSGDPIIGGGSVGISFGVNLKGAGTAGAAPEYGAALRGCGFSETLTAADVTGTAQAGATGTITLAAGASAVDDAYKGMVIELDGGTGSGQSNIITAYDGTTKIATVAANWTTPPDATSTYAIVANALYRPASSGLENLAFYEYQHAAASGGNSILKKILGAAGSMQLEITNRELAKLNFTFTGILPEVPSSVSHPGAATYDDVRPEAFKNAQSLLGGEVVKFNRFTSDLGANVAQADDPAATYGYDVAGITARKITGTINPNLIDVATRDNMTDFLNSNTKTIVMRWGSVAGKRVSILMPTVTYTGLSGADINGFAHQEIPFQCDGENNGLWICVH